MAIFKRGKFYWMDAIVNGVRYRESLKTTDRRIAPGIERERVGQLMNKAPNPTRRSDSFKALEIAAAVIDLYRRSEVAGVGTHGALLGRAVSAFGPSGRL